MTAGDGHTAPLLGGIFIHIFIFSIFDSLDIILGTGRKWDPCRWVNPVEICEKNNPMEQRNVLPVDNEVE